MTFDIDANGIVHVNAKDLGTGKEQHITITSSTNLSEAEIQKKVKEAEQYAEADRKKKDAVEAHNKAESMVYECEKTLEELGDEASEQEKAVVKEKIEAVKAVMNSDDAEAINKAVDELTKAFHPLAEKVYQKAAAAQQAQAGGAAEGPGKDGAVDADYEVVD